MSTATGRQRIFISYRREEASGHAGRIYDAMVARFGEQNVFMDVDIAPGVDFVDYISSVVSSCTVLIAVMGKSWAQVPGPNGQPRLRDEADFVRLEVGTAIQNPDVTVIPALVDKAQMPKADQLPDEMRPLARRNALELSDGRWRYDVGRLNDTLEQLLVDLTGIQVTRGPGSDQGPDRGTEASDPAPPPPPPGPTAPPLRLLAEGVLVAALAALFGRFLAGGMPELKRELLGGQVDPVIRQTVTWAIVGIALALWLGIRDRRTNFLYLGLLGLLVGALAGLIGSALWSISVAPPPVSAWTPSQEHVAENWAVANFAITGALLGALVGGLWRRRQLMAGLVGGLLGGALIQAIVNGLDWNASSMPGLAFLFALRSAAICAGALALLLALEQRRAVLSRSSSPARAPAAR